MASGLGIGLLLAALLGGIKHGVDWDHIAAITDITSTQPSARKGAFYSFLYAVGHATVVTVIAIALLLASYSIPEGVDKTMERVVGVTLIALGIYVLYSLHNHKGDNFRMLPRWAIFANGLLRIYTWLKAKITGSSREHIQVLKDGYGKTASYVIGMIHGVGAETPTQMTLYAIALTAAAGAVGEGGKKLGGIIILTFSIGLITTNTLMGVLGAYGYTKSENYGKFYRAVALFTGLFSLVLGTLFVFGATSYLPDLEALVS